MKIASVLPVFLTARLALLWVYLFIFSACSDGGNQSQSQAPQFESLEELGEALFFDPNLSLNRSQSCATCHNPEHGFIDSRLDASGQVTAFSLGDDGLTFGDRNTPTASYARFSPTFQLSTHTRFNSKQDDYVGYIGGQFWDGRAADLVEQAMGPPLNPIEMAMPDKVSVAERLQENDDYVRSFEFLFGTSIFNDADQTYRALAEAIQAFEHSDFFSPFDSKYDRFLRGEYVYDPLSKSANGKALFFSQQFTNCATCHQLHPNSARNETFTGYEYHNIGVPANDQDRLLVGKEQAFIDSGLQAHPANLENPNELSGKFKTPTLRNIAITAPYMHNGVFKELRTVIEFYEHFKEAADRPLNPETGTPWGDPEVAENINEDALNDGDVLSDQEIEDLVCFLRTLTDARYEHLIEDNGIDCGE